MGCIFYLLLFSFFTCVASVFLLFDCFRLFFFIHYFRIFFVFIIIIIIMNDIITGGSHAGGQTVPSLPPLSPLPSLLPFPSRKTKGHPSIIIRNYSPSSSIYLLFYPPLSLLSSFSLILLILPFLFPLPPNLPSTPSSLF